MICCDVILIDAYCVVFLIFFRYMQPESPAQLGGKIYEMMTMALTDKWATPGSEFIQPPLATNTPSPGTAEAEIVEPAEAEIVEPAQAGSQK